MRHFQDRLPAANIVLRIQMLSPLPGRGQDKVSQIVYH
jgi:hypothetical protein